MLEREREVVSTGSKGRQQYPLRVILMAASVMRTRICRVLNFSRHESWYIKRG